MKIIDKLLTVNEFSRPGKKRSKTTKIAVHYVGNAGTSAEANRNYFESLKDKHLYASSHYIIGLKGEIIRCVPEAEIAYTTNSANAYSIGIECCHPKSDGVFNQYTRQALIELCADLCKRYHLDPINDIIRHYDVTKKQCPLAWAADSGPKYQDFVKFKLQVKDCMRGKSYEVKPIKVKLYGTITTINAITIDNSNYCQIRALDKKGVFEVGYQNQSITINGKPFASKNTINDNGINFVKLQDLNDYLKIGYDMAKKMPIIDAKER